MINQLWFLKAKNLKYLLKNIPNNQKLKKEIKKSLQLNKDWPKCFLILKYENKESFDIVAEISTETIFNIYNQLEEIVYAKDTR